MNNIVLMQEFIKTNHNHHSHHGQEIGEMCTAHRGKRRSRSSPGIAKGLVPCQARLCPTKSLLAGI